MPNFMNILPLASSLGPLMCFTFDHLLCPAHRAQQSCSDRTEEDLHAGYSTRWTDSTGAVYLPEVAARVRRALSAAPAMSFTHRRNVKARPRYDLPHPSGTYQQEGV